MEFIIKECLHYVEIIILLSILLFMNIQIQNDNYSISWTFFLQVYFALGSDSNQGCQRNSLKSKKHMEHPL